MSQGRRVIWSEEKELKIDDKSDQGLNLWFINQTKPSSAQHFIELDVLILNQASDQASDVPYTD